MVGQASPQGAQYKHTTIQAHNSQAQHNTSTPQYKHTTIEHAMCCSLRNRSPPQGALVVQAHHGVAAGLLQRNRRFGNLDGQLEKSNG